MLHDNILSTSEHNHAPEPAKNEASKVVSAIRRRALEGIEFLFVSLVLKLVSAHLKVLNFYLCL